MITFRQFLDEEARTTKGAVKGTAEEIADILRDRCGEFIDAYRKTSRRLYRGVSGVGRIHPPPCVYSPIRTDRRPVEMDAADHKLISDVMEDLGMPSRRNGLFVSSSLSTAEDWGVPYMVFLEDGWKGVVFEEIGPHQYAFDTFSTHASFARRSERFGKGNAREMIEEFIKSQKPFVFDNAAGLNEVIHRQYMDIIMSGKGYYALWADGEVTKEVLKVLEI